MDLAYNNSNETTGIVSAIANWYLFDESRWLQYIKASAGQ